MIAEIPVDVPDGSELLAVATFMRAADGEITIRIANVTGVESPWTPAAQARALRMLATGVGAEAIAQPAGDRA
jgi:hypothetical protein